MTRGPVSVLTVSMSEIIRVGTWSLRALGLPFGVADRAVRLVAWSEAVQGEALRVLRLGEAALLEATRRTGPIPRRRDAAGSAIDGTGRHLLEIGPPALDLATADARTQGIGRTIVSGAQGGWLASALCGLALRRGLAVIATWRAAPEEAWPGRAPRAGWVAGFRAGGDETVFLAGAPGAAPAATLAQFERTPLRLDGALASAVVDDLEGLRRSDAGASPHLALTLLRRPTDLLWDGAVRADLPLADYGQRLARAYREGIPVAAEDLRHLYAVEQRSWAPTSERSRGQAGYGVY